jgi:hypothetical protein
MYDTTFNGTPVGGASYHGNTTPNSPAGCTYGGLHVVEATQTEKFAFLFPAPSSQLFIAFGAVKM